MSNAVLNWLPADTTKPSRDRAVIVLIGEQNAHWARAMWVPKNSREDNGSYEGRTEYNEVDDTYYWPEGWYEWNHAEEVHWLISIPVLFWADISDALPRSKS